MRLLPFALTAFLATAGGQLTRLVHNPFNLRLTVELLTDPIQLSTVERGRLSGARTRLDLLDAYWAHRVDSQDRIARADLLTRKADTVAYFKVPAPRTVVTEMPNGQGVSMTTSVNPLPLTDDWALRELRICVRNLGELGLYARELVESLRAA